MMSDNLTIVIKTKQEQFADSIANYISTHPSYDGWDKKTAATEAIRILFNDIGAAQGFLDALGVSIDLYATTFEQVDNEPETPVPS